MVIIYINLLIYLILI